MICPRRTGQHERFPFRAASRSMNNITSRTSMTLHYGLCEMESLYKRHIFQRIDSYYLITVAEDEYFAGNHL